MTTFVAAARREVPVLRDDATVGEAVDAVLDAHLPALPVVLTGANANGFADTQAARSYLLAGETTLHTPAVESFKPVSLAGKGAQAVYIVPDDSYAAHLAPP